MYSTVVRFISNYQVNVNNIHLLNRKLKICMYLSVLKKTWYSLPSHLVIMLYFKNPLVYSMVACVCALFAPLIDSGMEVFPRKMMEFHWKWKIVPRLVQVVCLSSRGMVRYICHSKYSFFQMYIDFNASWSCKEFSKCIGLVSKFLCSYASNFLSCHNDTDRNAWIRYRIFLSLKRENFRKDLIKCWDSRKDALYAKQESYKCEKHCC